jgi:hypothetical protein
MDVEVPNEKARSKDQQFQGFEEVIFEKDPMSKELKQVPTTSKYQLSEDSTAQDLPTATWTFDQVENWAIFVSGEASAKILRDQEITGKDLLTNNYTQADLERWGIKGGPAGRIISALTKMTTPKEGKRKADNLDDNRQGKFIKIDIDDVIEKIKNLPTIQALPFPTAKPESEFYDRAEPLKIVQKYIDGVANKSSEYFQGVTSKKFSLLGTSGMKGIGKTQLLVQIGAICKHSSEGYNVHSIYITFNGGGQNADQFIESYHKCNNYSNAFGHLLLRNCNVPQHLYSQLNFNQSIQLIRDISKLAENDILLILVDEIGHLYNPHDKCAISSLMSCMDSTESAGKLIFIFAHISQEFLNQQATGSGRCVIQLPLPPLEIDIWKKLKFSELWDLNEASRNHPSLHQLFLSCSGHPRSIFEGIPVALSKNRSLLTDPNSTAITNARQTIIEMSKFIDFKVVLDVTIKKWFSQLPLSDKEEIEWSSSGLLHTLKDTKVQFLFPLLIQQWACDHCDKKTSCLSPSTTLSL